jgi:transcriptional regulator with XRE-family HTH domain
MTVDERPFSTRLDELRRREGLTFRALEAHLHQHAEPGERGMNSGHLAGLTTGRRAPTPEVVALVARAFGLPPQDFIEWRLWEVQQLFDPSRPGGLEAAAAELRAFLDSAGPRAFAQTASRESRRKARAAVSAAR